MPQLCALLGHREERGLAHHGHQVRIGTRQSSLDDLPVGSPAVVAEGADLVFLAVVGTAPVDVASGVRDLLRGKVLVDTTNPLDFSTGVPGLFVGHTDSLGVLEPMCIAWVRCGARAGSWDHAFRLLRR